ncbi:MAG: 3-methyl-2-oxobutanoate hydroxymethyltransferase [Ilumatobacteraceae bacterium]
MRITDLVDHARPIVMVTAYDFPTAEIVDEAGVDIVLVGDSAANVVLGYATTVPVSVDELLVLVRAVRRGVRGALLVADLPFGSYEVSDEQAVATAIRFVKEGGADAVKLERAGTSVARAAAVVAAGIPVMGHVGLTPQTATALGGFRAQGRQAGRAAAITRDALALQAAGCFSVVLEAVPAPVAARTAELLEVPVIGIGAGHAVDGQVLVLHDLVGLTPDPAPKFVQRYADARAVIGDAVRAYVDDVRAGRFPTPAHTYPIADDELAAYQGLVTDL